MGLSHREIAKRLGISKSRVQQLEASALMKLRRIMESRGVADGWAMRQGSGVTDNALAAGAPR